MKLRFSLREVSSENKNCLYDVLYKMLIADLRASSPPKQAAAPVTKSFGVRDSSAHDKIRKIVAMLRNRSLVRDADITAAGLK